MVQPIVTPVTLQIFSVFHFEPQKQTKRNSFTSDRFMFSKAKQTHSGGHRDVALSDILKMLGGADPGVCVCVCVCVCVFMCVCVCVCVRQQLALHASC